MRNECTQISLSFTTSDIRRDIVTRIKYLAQRCVERPTRGIQIHAPQLHIDAQIALILLLDVLE
jgi:hypothetical protein